ncbi:predicted protein [Nematostella vectensis]|uniref:J domain-containing protein n=1 Tax=Nematostella vectensis TaxID=45351 RepID=A7SGJ2_NEMVE|nr:predicted protein [Nematostella vectensis]|eukprot:XP_001629209.1 predicted protein [Nematostella vectensis]
MEGNKDEALKCRHLAEKYLREGQTDKAIKFLKKSERLFPTKHVQDLLDSLSKNGASGGARNGDLPDGVRHRSRTHSTGKDKEEAPKEPKEKDYTPEQLSAVKKIQNCKDYYEILGISRDAPEEDIKKKYKKLALQFHPDKNRAPGATEAFKAIGNAFAVLTDAQKRQRYDKYGDENPQPQLYHNHYDYSRGFEADITPEEIFNMFFGGPESSSLGRVFVNRRHRGTRHHHFHQHDEGQEANQQFYSILQFLPILLLVLMSLLSTFMLQDPPYSLHRTSAYHIQRNTYNYQITYWVQEGFQESYADPQSLQKLEKKIERDYVNRLQTQCYRERQYRKYMSLHTYT